MAQKFSQWLSTLAIITMMMTLVPLGSAAPVSAQSISGTNTRDENVLRTSGVSRDTCNPGGTGLTDNGAVEVCGAGGLGGNRESPETSSIAEIAGSNSSQSIGDANFVGAGGARLCASGNVCDSQVVRVRGSFFKNNTNADIIRGGASEIAGVFFTLKDRNSGDFAIIRVTRGPNNNWDQGAAARTQGAGDDAITVFCRTNAGTRRFVANVGAATVFSESPGNANFTGTTINDKDTPPIACGGGDRPFLSSVQFSSDIGSTDQYGTTEETLQVSIQFAFPTPDVAGPVDIYTSVVDDDNFADGLDLYSNVRLGTPPTVRSSLSQVGGTVAAGSATRISITGDDEDTRDDLRALVATVTGSDGRFIQLIYYNEVDLNYRNSDQPGGQSGGNIDVGDIERRYQIYDSQRNRYQPTRPTDSGTITAPDFGTLNVDDSTTETSGSNQLTVNFSFVPNANFAGTARVSAMAVDREFQGSGMVNVGNAITITR